MVSAGLSVRAEPLRLRCCIPGRRSPCEVNIWHSWDDVNPCSWSQGPHVLVKPLIYVTDNATLCMAINKPPSEKSHNGEMPVEQSQKRHECRSCDKICILITPSGVAHSDATCHPPHRKPSLSAPDFTHLRDPCVQPLVRKRQARAWANCHPHAALPPSRAIRQVWQSRMFNIMGSLDRLEPPCFLRKALMTPDVNFIRPGVLYVYPEPENKQTTSFTRLALHLSAHPLPHYFYSATLLPCRYLQLLGL